MTAADEHGRLIVSALAARPDLAAALFQPDPAVQQERDHEREAEDDENRQMLRQAFARPPEPETDDERAQAITAALTASQEAHDTLAVHLEADYEDDTPTPAHGAPDDNTRRSAISAMFARRSEEN